MASGLSRTRSARLRPLTVGLAASVGSVCVAVGAFAQAPGFADSSPSEGSRHRRREAGDGNPALEKQRVRQLLLEATRAIRISSAAPSSTTRIFASSSMTGKADTEPSYLLARAALMLERSRLKHDKQKEEAPLLVDALEEDVAVLAQREVALWNSETPTRSESEMLDPAEEDEPAREEADESLEDANVDEVEAGDEERLGLVKGHVPLPVHRAAVERREDTDDGLQLTVAPHSAVVAVAAGEVVFAGRRRGLLQVVVDHGHRYISTYSALAEMMVEEGDYVSARATIGRVDQEEPALRFSLKRGTLTLPTRSWIP